MLEVTLEKPMEKRGIMPSDRDQIPELTRRLLEIQKKGRLYDKEMAEQLGVATSTWKKLKSGKIFYGSRTIKMVLAKYPEFLPLVVELPDEWDSRFGSAKDHLKKAGEPGRAD